MDEPNGMSMQQRVNIYKQYDAARQKDLDDFATRYESMQIRVRELEADLFHERTSRRDYQSRAEAADRLSKQQFAVVLIDGDGYHFDRDFYHNASNSGGAQAAHTLYTEIQQYLRNNDKEYDSDVEVLAFVYFSKHGLARALVNAEFIQQIYDFDQFLWSFTSRYSLFQTVDCGPGKERADAKLRDTYRFYSNHAQCKHIFLACCHDSGYIVELEKYRHDQAASKTVLIEHGATTKHFYKLGMPFARLANTFHGEHLPVINRNETVNPSTWGSKTTRIPSNDDVASETSNGAPTSPTWSTVTAGAVRLPLRTNTSFSLKASAESFDPAKPSNQAANDVIKGIPVNRSDQRVDKKMAVPSSTEQGRFAERIKVKKLCNNHHLSKAGCPVHKCGFDHSNVDANLRHTLKFKARSIPCASGSDCRNEDCYFGHHCPWGNSTCNNIKCAFYKNGLHDIDDQDIARYATAWSEA